MLSHKREVISLFKCAIKRELLALQMNHVISLELFINDDSIRILSNYINSHTQFNEFKLDSLMDLLEKTFLGFVTTPLLFEEKLVERECEESG